MPRGDVGDFVRHAAGQFRFGVGRQNQARVYEEIAAGKEIAFTLSSSITLIVNGNFASELRARFCAEAVDVLGDHRVVDDAGALLHLLRHLLSQRDFLWIEYQFSPLLTSRLPIWSGSFLGSCAQTADARMASSNAMRMVY